MPVKGRAFHFTPFSLASDIEVAQALQMAKSTAIEAMLCMIMGDPNPTAVGWGAKRCAFRWADLFPVPTSPATMQVNLTPGTAVMNDGEAHQGSWYLCWANEGEKHATFDAAHSTLDRYDILYAIPAKVGTGTVNREVVDAQGNVSTVNDVLYDRDEFTLAILKGTPGSAFPTVGELPASRFNAWNLLPTGHIPIAIVRVPAAATEITGDDITDVREVFDWRSYAVGEAFLPDSVKAALGATRANSIGGLSQVFTDAGLLAVPQLAAFVDMRGEDPVLKFKFDNDNIREIAFVPED